MKLPFSNRLGSWREWFNPLPIAVIGLVLLFCWLLVFGDQGILTWSQLARKKTELANEETRLTQKLKDLETETKRLEDPKYLEPIIRKELGFVRPGETVFQFPEENNSKR